MLLHPSSQLQLLWWRGCRRAQVHKKREDACAGCAESGAVERAGRAPPWITQLMLSSCTLGRWATSSCCRRSSSCHRRAAAAVVCAPGPRRCAAAATAAVPPRGASMTPQDCEKLRAALGESLNSTRRPLKTPLVSQACGDHYNVGQKLQQLGVTGPLQHELLDLQVEDHPQVRVLHCACSAALPESSIAEGACLLSHPLVGGCSTIALETRGESSLYKACGCLVPAWHRVV